MHPRAPTLALVTLGALAARCAPGPSRFALRPPVTHDIEHPIAHAPRPVESARMTDAIDELLLRPVTRTLALETDDDAVNVNALDEVPDSHWFTNRTPTPAESAEGACRGIAPPVLPLRVEHVKDDGTTPGFLVRDATGRRYVTKLDIYPSDRPETSTAADAIVSRLYWTLGYNVPCNRVAYVRPDEIEVPGDAYRTGAQGEHLPIDRDAVLALFGQAVRRGDGAYRVGLSLMVEGETLGPWPGVGVRSDDPNDVVPHEDRRELRGERLLAAWVNHWDSREINTLDAFVLDDPAPGSEGGPGYVVHYLIDFGDTLGGRTSQPERAQRLGYAGFLQAPWARHPWEHTTIDPRAPGLGYFEFEHFDPSRWQPILPLPRFERAQTEDLAWMARRIARVTDEHLRAMIAAGAFSRPATVHRLFEVLAGRRDRILRWSFAHRSPLTDWRDVGDRLCGVDLGISSGITRAGSVRYRARLVREGRDEELTVQRVPPAGVCALVPHRAAEGPADDAPERYRVVRVTRDDGDAHTEIRLHAYDLGAARGYALAGVDR